MAAVMPPMGPTPPGAWSTSFPMQSFQSDAATPPMPPPGSGYMGGSASQYPTMPLGGPPFGSMPPSVSSFPTMPGGPPFVSPTPTGSMTAFPTMPSPFSSGPLPSGAPFPAPPMTTPPGSFAGGASFQTMPPGGAPPTMGASFQTMPMSPRMGYASGPAGPGGWSFTEGPPGSAAPGSFSGGPPGSATFGSYTANPFESMSKGKGKGKSAYEGLHSGFSHGEMSDTNRTPPALAIPAAQPTEHHAFLNVGEYWPLYPNPQTPQYGVYLAASKYYVIWATAPDLPAEGEVFIDRASAKAKFSALTGADASEAKYLQTGKPQHGKGQGKGNAVANAAILTNEEFRELEFYGSDKHRMDDFKRWWLTRKEDKVKQQFCSKAEDYFSWGRAQLRNIVDVHCMTLRERLANPWKWTFIHAQGWLINFWDEDFMAEMHEDLEDGGKSPVCTIDIRQVFAVNIAKDGSSAEGGMCPWEVHLNFQNGFLPFRVKTELEARAWKGRIMNGIVENVKINQFREKLGERRAGMEEVDIMVIHKDPARISKLKKLWMEAVRGVTLGVKPHKKIFFELYRVYAELEDGDGSSLSMHEIEVMAKEFLEMKLEEVKKIVVSQEKLLYSNHKPVTSAHEEVLRMTIDQGRQLMRFYEHMRDPAVFMDRVVSFHSRTDISREGKVDITEFMIAAPVFLMPLLQLKAEAAFFRSAARSNPEHHEARERLEAELRLQGKTMEAHQADECNQQ